MKTFNRLWRLFIYFFRAYPSRSILVCILLLFTAFAEGIGMASLLPLLNIVLERDGESELNRAVVSWFNYMGVPPTTGSILIIIVVLITLKSLFVQVVMTQVSYTANRVAANMRLELIRGLMSARWSYFVKQRSGNLTAALSTEPTRAGQTYRSLCNMLVALVQALAYVALAATISLPITFAALGVGGLTALALNRFVRLSSQAGQARTTLQRRFLSLLADSIGAMKPIKATASERRVLPLLERYIEDFNAAQDRTALTTEALKNLQEPIRVAAAAAGFYFLIGLWGDSPDTLILLTLLFLRTVDRLGSIQRFLQQTLNNHPAFWFVRSVIDQAQRAKEKRPGGHAPTLEKDIAVRRLHFTYNNVPVLDGLSMTIPARTMVSLIGRSGSGKSTLADLLTGLQVANSGEIYIDGEPLHKIDILAWRRMIGYVPQDTVLFHDTVLANVTLGDPELDRKAAETALNRAEAWDFVTAMPNGLDTLVGERGARLSGGQRQRIALARALVRNPALLILDEATSALDPKTERSICATLKHLSRELTILVISHNQALVDVADRVYELENGMLTMRPDPVDGPAALSTT
ncbi:MAG: ABC transporter ATP-binding protein [Kiloniellaceae bacterium]